MLTGAEIRAAAESGAATLPTLKAARRAAADHTIERNTSWQYACAWAGGLSDAELRTAAKLKIPGDAGLAAGQELGRRKTAR